MICIKNENKICNDTNKKCKTCTLDDIREAYNLTDYWNERTEKEKREEFERQIPEECKKCTLLEKDITHKKLRCLYRSKNRCILEPYIGGNI